MFSKVISMGVFGVDAFMVEVEADIMPGYGRYNIVGLPDAAVSEARDRVRSAINNSGKHFPSSQITVNLAPADVRKEGPVYDLPMLVALLSASNQLREDAPLSDSVFIGELSLNGEVRRINGVLPMILKAQELGFKSIFVPAENESEGISADKIKVYPVTDVRSLIKHLNGEKEIYPVRPEEFHPESEQSLLDFSDVKGQYVVKRSLEVAAAGGHNVIMIGPPGSGKSMLAKRIPTILPDMTRDEAIETTKLHSIAGCLPLGTSLIKTRPFRAPHHTTSAVGLSGGGSIPSPGEISLAHNGVLFLDELPEFPRNALEVMRQPMENGHITISRVSGTVTYPCSVMVVAAMNPCPCGYYGHPTRQCICGSNTVAKYINKLSGPLLDRMDIQIEVPPVQFETMSSKSGGETSVQIRNRVNAARKIQSKRFEGTGVTCNAHMNEKQISEFCVITDGARELLKQVFDIIGLSARGHDKILKISRTIADLDGSDIIDETHIAEAINYRSLDKKYWM